MNAFVGHVAVEAEETEVVVAGDGATDGEGVTHGCVGTLIAACKGVCVYMCCVYVCVLCMRVVYIWMDVHVRIYMYAYMSVHVFLEGFGKERIHLKLA